MFVNGLYISDHWNKTLCLSLNLILTLMCQIKVHKLKKMHKFMGNYDINFFFISILFILLT